MILKFEDIKFAGNGGSVRGYFLRNFYFDIPKNEIEKRGKWKVIDGNLEIQGSEVMRKRFDFILEQKLQQLKSLQGKPATYIYEGFLPLIGSLYFGLIDRDTNIIELRPITGCNQKCVFCSVDLECRQRDFVVNADYLLKEFRKLAELKLKKVKAVEAHINAQGEPLLYSKLAELIKGLSKVKGVETISMDTNAILLTKEKVNELVDAGLTRFNISIEALTEKRASAIAGIYYPLEHVKEICRYIASKSQFLLAPVWLHGMNDDEIENIIKFALQLRKIQEKAGVMQEFPILGIQNFLEYERGRNPVKQQPWPVFYSFLERLEKKYGLKLKLSREDFGIVKCASEKPFRKDKIIDAKIVCGGMLPKEMLAVSDDRVIVLPNSKEKKIDKKARVKITRDKYNVFYAKVV